MQSQIAKEEKLKNSHEIRQQNYVNDSFVDVTVVHSSLFSTFLATWALVKCMLDSGDTWSVKWQCREKPHFWFYKWHQWKFWPCISGDSNADTNHYAPIMAYQMLFLWFPFDINCFDQVNSWHNTPLKNMHRSYVETMSCYPQKLG